MAEKTRVVATPGTMSGQPPMPRRKVDVEAVQAVLESIPDVPPEPGDELPEIEVGYGSEALEILNAMEPPKKRDNEERVEPKKRPK